MQQIFSSLAFSPTKCYAEKFENNYSDRFRRKKMATILKIIKQKIQSKSNCRKPNSTFGKKTKAIGQQKHHLTHTIEFME